jgi:hypothetical protein
LAGDSKIVNKATPPPPLNTAANSKIANLKCVFLGKYLDNFFI